MENKSSFLIGSEFNSAIGAVQCILAMHVENTHASA